MTNKITLQITLPRDAKGREIPLDTTVLFDKDGKELCVKRIEFDPLKKEWSLAVRIDSVSRSVVYRRPRVVYLEKPAPPDSWEKLEEDFDKCIKACDTCRYFSQDGTCSTCAISGNSTGGCDGLVLKDIKERIRKLRGDVPVLEPQAVQGERIRKLRGED